MSDVKRLKVTIKTNEGGYATGVELAEDPSGGLVLAKDYDALATTWYNADGTTTTMSPDELVAKRKEAAKKLADYDALAAKHAALAEAANAVKSGAAMIAAERQRQVSSEFWTPEHDDQHRHDELALAAMLYVTPSERRDLDAWPFEPEAWKPTPQDRVRELVKAGAMIAAEIDRLLRCAILEPRP